MYAHSCQFSVNTHWGWGKKEGDPLCLGTQLYSLTTPPHPAVPLPHPTNLLAILKALLHSVALYPAASSRSTSVSQSSTNL